MYTSIPIVPPHALKSASKPKQMPSPNPIINNSHHRAPDPIHGPLDLALNQIPIGPPLRKLIDLLRAKDAVEAIPVRDDGRQLLGIRRVDEVDLRQLPQRREELQEIGVLERLDVGEVEVHITRS